MNINQIITAASGDISKDCVREKICQLEDVLLTYPQVEIPVVHRFSGGIYAREITIPKDTFLTGAIYKDDHFDVMVYGDVTVTSDDGKKRLTGFNIFEGKSGKKRAGYTHEETRWITFCSSHEMDEDHYLNYLTVDSFSKLESGEAAIKRAFQAQSSYRKGDYPIFKAGYLAARSK